MRPHSLRLQAFGAFAGTVSLDLDALAAGGLFLLHGPTGAGKSTLLDGIGFALFGRVPGARGAAARLRSDHAAPALRTEVELEATFGGRRVRLTRSPAWERAKKTGTGTTVEPARVLLEELRDGAWETLSTRPREADDEVLDLVGMSAEQFFSVVLLPQGEFAGFLRAKSVDRAALLERLFSTERFGAVEDWLAVRRRAVNEKVGAAQDAVTEVVARIAEVSEAALPEADEVAWASALREEAAALVTVADGVVAARAAERDTCREAAESAVRLAGLQARRRAALAAAQELELQRPARVAQQAELEAAARAAEVAALLTAVTTRRAVRDRALTDADLACAGIATDVLEDLPAAVAAARERTGRLEVLREVERTRVELVTLAQSERDEQALALADVGRCEVELGVLPTRRSELEAHLAAARAAALTLPELRARREAAAAVRPDVVAVEQLRPQVLELREQVLLAGETALSLKDKAADLRVASINSMVARLAFALEDGVPCVVCGSVEHPDPSDLQGEGVSVEDEESARRAAEQAASLHAEVQARLASAQARLAELEARAGSWTVASLDTHLAELALEVDVVGATAARQAPSERALAELDARRAALTTAQVSSSGRADAAARRAADADERALACAAQLAAAGATDLLPALARASREVRALETAAAAVAALSTATRELDDAVHAAENACAAAGFASTAEAAEAHRAAAWRTDTSRALREAADLEVQLAAELEGTEVDLSVEAPVAATAAALAAADAALAVASEALGRCRAQHTALERLLPQLADLVVVLGPVLTEAREVRALADLCAGGGANGLKMTLASYVLAARLEEVAAAATVRLVRMTQGRYELVHTDGAARGGQRSGLGLLVRDSWTGEDRDTATLSGGETFVASLALALGLADVVTAEAGGARIGALFVDEGFGTLDEDALDEVMDVLDGLREGGRVVGLVSHVAELKQRIPTRVEVRKSRTGSDLVLHGC